MGWSQNCHYQTPQPQTPHPWNPEEWCIWTFVVKLLMTTMSPSGYMERCRAGLASPTNKNNTPQRARRKDLAGRSKRWPVNLTGSPAWTCTARSWTWLMWSVSMISFFGFSTWESQIQRNQLWMYFWHDVGFQCARVSDQKNVMKFRKPTVTPQVRTCTPYGVQCSTKKQRASVAHCSLREPLERADAHHIGCSAATIMILLTINT